jgi:DNA helicase-2/ATP-dependent DNA helicase PcrA
VYGWNGADPGLLEALPSLFERVRVIRLDDNHRSTPAIVRLAAAALGRRLDAIRCSRSEGPVPLLTAHESDDEEAAWVAREAWRAHRPGRRWSQMAVLARTNAQLETFVRAFSAQRIPVRLAGAELGPASDLGAVRRDATIHVEAERRQGPVDDDPDAVVLSTFHRSKGLQWPCVFVIGLCEGLVPIRSARSAAALAEERRLLYVAMTRAEDRLWCSWSSTSGPGAPARSASRWLDELEQARTQIEEERSPAPPQAAASHLARIRALVARDGPA